MTSPRPLFLTGIARCGGNLLGRMIGAHPEVRVAMDPFLELYRSLRNAVVRTSLRPDQRAAFAPSAPFSDYYFTEDRIALLDAILAATLDMEFESSEWDSFLATASARGALECPDLSSRYDRLRSRTYRGIFDRGLDLIRDGRNGNGCAWIGTKEVWVTEFLPALARAYPDARFIILLRDPRAILHSHVGGARIDPAAAASLLSYARHWRKTAACAIRFGADAALSDRVLVCTYERLVREPRAAAEEICRFLDLPFHTRMMDTSSYRDARTGGVWNGNSSFQPVTQGFESDRADQWVSRLDPGAIALADFVCGPEMGAFGYARRPAGPADPAIAAVDAIFDNHRRCEEYCNWRTDFADPQQDAGYELFRDSLLRSSPAALDPATVRRSFLFTEVFERLRREA